jgi:hypothetical protein
MTELEKLREFVRGPEYHYGGYRAIGIMSDGELICRDCVREEYRLIYRSTRDNERDGWAFMGYDAYWEGCPDLCCHCGKEIPSEYGCIEGDENCFCNSLDEA